MRLLGLPSYLLMALGILPALGCGQDPGDEDPGLPEVEHPASYVVPFIGSGGFGYAHGSAFPGASAPHGLAKVGPDTKGPYGTVNFLHYSGYWYGDNVIQGFSHLHLHGTGATDYGVLSLMPSLLFDEGRRTRDGYGALFDKKSEVATPGFYGVTLLFDGSPVQVEIAATPHGAHHRYRFDKGVRRHLILDLDHHLEGGKVPDAEVRLFPAERQVRGKLRHLGGMSGGYGGYDVYFVMRFRSEIKAALFYKEGQKAAPGTESRGLGVGVDLEFAPAMDQMADPLEVQVGLSLVDEEGALANLQAELRTWDLDQTRKDTYQSWDSLLSTVIVDGGTEAERQTFYSALYRAFLMPTVHSDVDGRYRGHDNTVRRVTGWSFVSDLSLWDTYRTLHPLYAMLFPEHARDAARSLVLQAQQRGSYPKWPLAGGDSGSMIGAGADMVLADTYLRGVTDFDAETAYALAREAALSEVPPKGGRGGRNSEEYLRLGYVPDGRNGSVSLTTELARDDAALAKWALALGKSDDAKALAARSLGYRKLYDPQVGFLRARSEAGGFGKEPFDPLAFSKPYTEANAWQSLWMPSHDLEGLEMLLGGREAFGAKLLEFFERAQKNWEEEDPEAVLTLAQPRPYYWAGNQPDIHAPYLFAQVGRHDLTTRFVRWSMKVHYGNTPAGLPGNDDGGTMSAWYLFAALGLYPDVGTDRLVLGVPLFPRIRLRLPNGEFVIVARNLSSKRYGVKAIHLAGSEIPLRTPILRQQDLKPGRTLEFTIGDPP